MFLTYITGVSTLCDFYMLFPCLDITSQKTESGVKKLIFKIRLCPWCMLGEGGSSPLPIR